MENKVYNFLSNMEFCGDMKINLRQSDYRDLMIDDDFLTEFPDEEGKPIFVNNPNSKIRYARIILTKESWTKSRAKRSDYEKNLEKK